MAGFDSYYIEVFGDRWEKLKAALLKEPKHIELESGYKLDQASKLVAESLDVKPGLDVLDLCAAPGGKTLVLAEYLQGSGRLVSNDRSSQRRARLKKVLSEYLSEEKRQNIEVTGHDSTKWCLYEKEAYDRILLDAPCSSERHVLNDEKELKKWTPSRPKQLAFRQYTMLVSALDVLRSGGKLVYSTCALLPVENDEVIAKLLKKRAGKFSVLGPKFSTGEKTEYGWLFLPDKVGFGPMYVCQIQKN